MFERFTELTRYALFFARQEALRAGAPAIEPEHLLEGLRQAETPAQLPKEIPTERTSIGLSQASKRALAFLTAKGEIGGEELRAAISRAQSSDLLDDLN